MSEPRQEQVVAYLLGELEPEHAAEFERRLAQDVALQAEVAGLREVVGGLDALPGEVWEHADVPSLELPVGELPTRQSPAGRRTSVREWLMPRRVAIAACIGAALIFVGGVVVGTLAGGENGGQTSPDEIAAVFDLRPFASTSEAAAGVVEVSADDSQRANLVVDGLPRPPRGSFYELWLLGSDGLVSLGSFQVTDDGHAETMISVPVDPSSYESFDVSLERDDGDPSHSGNSVLRGPSSPA